MRYSLADLSERMFNRPVAITRSKAEIILGVIGPRLNVTSLVVAGEEGIIPIADLKARAGEERLALDSRPGDRDFEDQSRDPWTGVVEDPYEIWNGIAILRVRGTLMAEGGLNPSSGMTSYAGLDYKLRHARANRSKVKGLLFDVDSGGGEVVDLLEFCAHVMAAREEMPIRTIVRGMCASAAYAIGSCGHEVTSAAYSWSGSIGALIAHADFSEAHKQKGVGVTLIGSAPHKTDGTSHLPLADEVRAKFQREVDNTATAFIQHVAAARGRSVDEIAAQEARFYSGEEALGAGLVDKIMAWDDSLREFAETVNRRQPSAANPALGGNAASVNRGEARMDRENLAPAAENQPEHSAETQTAAVSAAVTAERARVGQLAELDAESNISPALSAAISEGTSAGDFAIQLTKAARNQQRSALEGARADAVSGDALPGSRTDAAAGNTEVNRGVAAVDRLRGKHKGLRSPA